MALVSCAWCGLEFHKLDRFVEQSANHFCSRSCAARLNNRKFPKRTRSARRTKICQQCGCEYELRVRGWRAEKQKYCGRDCAADSLRIRIDSPEGWKQNGKFIDRSKGYVLAYAPWHPKATNRGYVYEHRLVMEEKLGRFLRSDEHVHHRNGTRWDNRPENLEVLESHEHARLAGQRPEDLLI